MYDRILAAIDAAPDAPDDSLARLTKFAKMTGGTVHLLHVARGHVVAYDINAGSRLDVLDGEDDVPAGEQRILQDAVDQLAAAGVTVHGELINATEHDIADLVVQRASDLAGVSWLFSGRAVSLLVSEGGGGCWAYDLSGGAAHRSSW